MNTLATISDQVILAGLTLVVAPLVGLLVWVVKQVTAMAAKVDEDDGDGTLYEMVKEIRDTLRKQQEQ